MAVCASEPMEAREYSLEDALGEGFYGGVFAWDDDKVIKLYRRGKPISCTTNLHDRHIRTAFWECLVNTYLNAQRLPAPRTEGLVTLPTNSSDEVYLGLVVEQVFAPVWSEARKQQFDAACERITRKGLVVGWDCYWKQTAGGIEKNNVMQDAQERVVLIDYGMWKARRAMRPVLAKMYEEIAAPEHIAKPSFAELLEGRVRD